MVFFLLLERLMLKLKLGTVNLIVGASSRLFLTLRGCLYVEIPLTRYCSDSWRVQLHICMYVLQCVSQRGVSLPPKCKPSSVTDLSKRGHYFRRVHHRLPSQSLRTHSFFGSRCKIFWRYSTFPCFLSEESAFKKRVRLRAQLWCRRELVWMRNGRLSNQIAGKVTAACI
jgi:hypothetical protein